MSGNYDEEQHGAKSAKRVFVIVAVLVAMAIAFGMFQAAKALTGHGAEVVNSKEVVTKQAKPANAGQDPAIATPEKTDGSVGMNTQPYDGGVGQDDLGVVYNFGTKTEMPFPGQQAEDRVIGETKLVPEYIGLAGTPVASTADCDYLSYGYYACPIGGAYKQIIDSLHQTTIAFAKKGSEMPSNVLDTFKADYPKASEGLGGGALEGYYIVSRGAVQNLTQG